MIGRNRSMCAHEWVAVTGATICVHCGQDLEKCLELIRKDAAPDADQQASEEPNVPTIAQSLATWPRSLVYILAGILGTVGGLVVAAGLVKAL